MRIDMVVAGLTIDPVSSAPVVILREKDSDRVLPIWIGVIEASAIAFELEKVALSRPLAHDLLKTVVTELGGKVERVAVVDLRENTYFASVVISQGPRSLELDARPSDAIALALRAGAPIQVEAHVIEAALAKRDEPKGEGATPSPSQAAPREEEVDRGEDGPKPIDPEVCGPMSTLLERLSPDAFGKYKM